MGKIIVLDAGHGGSDPGAYSGIRYEKDDNLKLAKAVQALLTKQGCTVVMTRADDSALSLAQRTNMANAAGADIYISLHRNSFTNSTANGVEIWVYTTAGAVDVGAATEVLERLAAVGVQSNRGIKQGNYHVLRESRMTSMLVELGFISNEKDNQLFDQHFDAYAKAIAEGICAAMGITYTEDSAVTNTDSNAGSTAPKYKVQVGAFSSEGNARAFLEQVQGMGLSAFLVVQEEVAKEN